MRYLRTALGLTAAAGAKSTASPSLASRCVRPMRTFLAMFAATTLLACGEDTEPTATLLSPPTGLFISPPGLSLIVGDEGRLTARAFDAMGRTTNTAFEWSSANPAIATVGRSDGIVTAIAAGTTTVTVIAGALSAAATVSVRPPDPPVAVTISPSTLSLIAGSAERLTARASDSTGRTSSVSFEWSSADLAIATVGKTDGIVTAISAGSTTVTVAVGALQATATVSVIEIARSFAFTRMTMLASGGSVTYTSDVLSYSSSDRTLGSLPRAAQFASISAPAWSSDGTLLAVEVMHDIYYDDHWGALFYNSDLYLLGTAASASTPWRALTTNGLSTSPSWSPDGRRIAYVQQEAHGKPGHIYIVDIAGGAPVRLTLMDRSYGGPRWSPDGTRLSVTDWDVGNGDIFILNADGSGMTNVTRNSAFDGDPSWSPDGTRLAFVSDRAAPPGSYQADVFIVDIDGSNVRRLTTRGGAGPVWSPDGRQIMFSAGDAIHVMNTDGSSLTRLTSPPAYSWDTAPVWKR